MNPTLTLTLTLTLTPGKYRQEGRNYVVQDGDIMLFQFNVTGAKKK